MNPLMTELLVQTEMPRRRSGAGGGTPLSGRYNTAARRRRPFGIGRLLGRALGTEPALSVGSCPGSPPASVAAARDVAAGNPAIAGL